MRWPVGVCRCHQVELLTIDDAHAHLYRLERASIKAPTFFHIKQTYKHPTQVRVHQSGRSSCLYLLFSDATSTTGTNNKSATKCRRPAQEEQEEGKRKNESRETNPNRRLPLLGHVAAASSGRHITHTHTGRRQSCLYPVARNRGSLAYTPTRFSYHLLVFLPSQFLIKAGNLGIVSILSSAAHTFLYLCVCVCV